MFWLSSLISSVEQTREPTKHAMKTMTSAGMRVSQNHGIFCDPTRIIESSSWVSSPYRDQMHDLGVIRWPQELCYQGVLLPRLHIRLCSAVNKSYTNFYQVQVWTEKKILKNSSRAILCRGLNLSLFESVEKVLLVSGYLLRKSMQGTPQRKPPPRTCEMWCLNGEGTAQATGNKSVLLNPCCLSSSDKGYAFQLRGMVLLRKEISVLKVHCTKIGISP